MPLRIIIVGAGIGGPAAAIGLARNGHKVTIYERSNNTSEVGYAFRLTPNSDRCLKYLNIDTVAGGAVTANTVRAFNAEGKLMREIHENQDADKAKKGTSVFAYRPGLNKQLMEAAVGSGVEVKTGVKVVSVDAEKTTIELEGGETVSADLIIAADGVHSVIRPYIVDTTRFYPQPSTGHNAFRFMVSKSTLQNDSMLGPIVDDNAHMFTWASKKERILVYPVDHDREFNVTCTHPEELSDKHDTEEDSADAIGKQSPISHSTSRPETDCVVAYNQKASFETVQRIYSGFEPKARRLLELADPNGFRIWKLMDMDEIPNWSVNHTVMLGDACHPVSPFGFSGASMSIEDALTLSTLLPSDVKREEIVPRLKLYEEIRKPRVGRVRSTARENAQASENKEDMRAYMEFLASHDAVEHAKQALQRQSGTKG